MITSSDSFTTYDLGKYYVILPQTPELGSQHAYIKEFRRGSSSHRASTTPQEKNSEFLSVDELKILIADHVQTS